MDPIHWTITPIGSKDKSIIKSTYKLPYSSRWFRAKDLHLDKGKEEFLGVLSTFIEDNRTHQGI